MRVQYHPEFIKKLKKLNIRIRKSFLDARVLFDKNPTDSHLNNHPLQLEWQDYESIDVTNDYCAIFEEIHEGDEKIAYFIDIGTHDELYG